VDAQSLTRPLIQVMAAGARGLHVARMPNATIPISLQGGPRAPDIEIDAARIARGLGLDVADFRQRMADRKITVLCERGTGEDAGRWRASFYLGDRRVRLVVDAAGNVLAES